MVKLNEEDALLNRLLYKESPVLRILSVKCLELSHLKDFSRIESSQSERLLNDLLEGIKEMDLLVERKELMNYSFIEDKKFLLEQQESLQAKIDTFRNEIEVLKENYAIEKSLRSNLIEYEKSAKSINKLPSTSEIRDQIANVNLEISDTDKRINQKISLMKSLSVSSQSLTQTLETLHSLNDLINS